MSIFYIFHFNKKKRRQLFWIAILLLTTIFIYTLISSPAIKPATLIQGNKQTKDLALTFHISWGDEKVNDILKTLRKHKTRATFFVSGEWAERHPQILQAIAENKHEIGMLGYEYKNYLSQNKATITEDITLAQHTFKKLGYEQIKYIRSPLGVLHDDIIKELQTFEMETVHWDVDPQDMDQPNAASLEKAVLQETKNGSIILLHASDDAKHTDKALQKIIPSLKEKDYTFKTLSELKYNIEMKETLIQ